MLGLLTFLRSPLGKTLGIGIAVLTLFGFIWFSGRSTGEKHVLAQDQKAINAAAQTNQAAVANADVERATDQAATNTLQKDLKDAYAQTPDAAPSAARLALACRRMREQARPGAKLPAKCGPSGPAQAAPRSVSAR